MYFLITWWENVINWRTTFVCVYYVYMTTRWFLLATRGTWKINILYYTKSYCQTWTKCMLSYWKRLRMKEIDICRSQNIWGPSNPHMTSEVPSLFWVMTADGTKCYILLKMFLSVISFITICIVYCDKIIRITFGD